MYLQVSRSGCCSQIGRPGNVKRLSVSTPQTNDLAISASYDEKCSITSNSLCPDLIISLGLLFRIEPKYDKTYLLKYMSSMHFNFAAR